MTQSNLMRSQKTDTEVLIIGAGMAGLYTAHRLKQSSVSFSVLESEDHAGGRVFS